MGLPKAQLVVFIAASLLVFFASSLHTDWRIITTHFVTQEKYLILSESTTSTAEATQHKISIFHASLRDSGTSDAIIFSLLLFYILLKSSNAQKIVCNDSTRLGRERQELGHQASFTLERHLLQFKFHDSEFPTEEEDYQWFISDAEGDTFFVDTSPNIWIIRRDGQLQEFCPNASDTIKEVLRDDKSISIRLSSDDIVLNCHGKIAAIDRISCTSRVANEPTLIQSPILSLPETSVTTIVLGVTIPGIFVLAALLTIIWVCYCRQRDRSRVMQALQAPPAQNQIPFMAYPVNPDIGMIVLPPPRSGQLGNAMAQLLAQDFSFLPMYEEEHTRCSVCFDQRPSCVSVPCGHVYCRTCIDLVQNKCPLCRQDMKNYVILRNVKSPAQNGASADRSRNRVIGGGKCIFCSKFTVLQYAVLPCGQMMCADCHKDSNLARVINCPDCATHIEGQISINWDAVDETEVDETFDSSVDQAMVFAKTLPELDRSVGMIDSDEDDVPVRPVSPRRTPVSPRRFIIAKTQLEVSYADESNDLPPTPAFPLPGSPKSPPARTSSQFRQNASVSSNAEEQGGSSSDSD